MQVSAVLIVKNEEERLRQCLESLHWVSEIIILDSGSVDETITIAKEYTDKVYVNTQWPGFGAQRQLAQGYASGDWIFVIDADEVVTADLAQELLSAVENNTPSCLYAVNRKNWAFGKFIHFSGWSPDWVVRLYPREKTTYCDSLVHESVVVPDSMLVQRLSPKSHLLHYTYDTLYDYNRKVAGYLKSWADQREATKKSSVFKGVTHGLFAFFRMYFLRLGFLDGRHGFILAFLTAYTTSMKYFDLWLRQNQKHE
jgi:(heptosyl)LPS beta-1,4-glucosyltransferase